MGRLTKFLRRITSVSTPIGGISWSPLHQEEKQKPPISVKQKPGTSEFSDGDWITAGIVAPERAVSVLQRITTSLNFRKNTSRQKRIDKILSALTEELSALRARYEAGGETVEARCEACIAKITADIINREMNSYRWKLDAEADTDPLDVLNGVIRDLMNNSTG